MTEREFGPLGLEHGMRSRSEGGGTELEGISSSNPAWRRLLCWLHVAIVANVFVPLGAINANATEPAASLVGRRVVQKERDFSLRVNDQVVSSRRFILFYKVDQTKDDWIWLKAEGKSLAGWAKADEVIPVEDGIVYFTRQIAAQPENAFHYVMRATLYDDRHDIDKALADYDEAIKLDPSQGWVFNNRGIAWTDKHEYDRALADFNEALRLDPQNANVFNNRGTIWRIKQIHDEAIADFNDAIRLFPEYAFAYYNRGLAWADKHEYDRAISDFDHVLSLDPQDALAHYNRGLALLKKHEYAKALPDLEESMKLGFKTAEVYYHRGLAEFELKNLEKAISDFSAALALNARYSEAFYNRGLAWAEKKDYVRAFADYEQAIRINPDYDQAYVSRAWLLVSCPDPKFRNAKRAIESATRACELTKWKQPYEIGTLAAAYVEAGDFAAAAKYQSRANELLNTAKQDGQHLR